jgi:hypothetical protein
LLDMKHHGGAGEQNVIIMKIDGLVKSQNSLKITNLCGLSTMFNRVIVDSEANMELGFLSACYRPTFYESINIQDKKDRDCSMINSQ